MIHHSRRSTERLFLFVLSLSVACTLPACGSGGVNESPAQAAQQLSSPAFVISGPGTNQLAATAYLFATSAGTIDTTGNTVTAVFSDPILPLFLFATDAYFDQVASGSCGSLAGLVATVTGASGNSIATQVSATGCTDQATITVLLDTTAVFDNFGNEGQDVVSATLTVDVAPTVSAAVTGNSGANGAGTTEASAGSYSLSGDNSIVVGFSKSLDGGALSATLSGCGATLGAPILVPGSNGRTVAWTLGSLTSVASGASCTLNVSGIADQAGNADDPSDPNASMTFTFHA